MKKTILMICLLFLLIDPILATAPIGVNEGRVLDRFMVSNLDTTVATREYFGYVAAEGRWYIMKENLSNSNLPIFTYASGTSGYAAAWTSREALVYTNPAGQ